MLQAVYAADAIVATKACLGHGNPVWTQSILPVLPAASTVVGDILAVHRENKNKNNKRIIDLIGVFAPLKYFHN